MASFKIAARSKPKKNYIATERKNGNEIEMDTKYSSLGLWGSEALR